MTVFELADGAVDGVLIAAVAEHMGVSIMLKVRDSHLLVVVRDDGCEGVKCTNYAENFFDECKEAGIELWGVAE